MTQHKLYNSQSAIVTSEQWDGDNVVFAGTGGAAARPPTVTFSGPNTLSGISDIGTAAAPGYGTINLMPGGALSAGSLTVNR
ncbi:MAG: hypothetical protein M3Y22_08150, partial [Pseudomonadota bacterium]|nr:hypothetical protein [Pseudomonadota bacterium]